MQKKASWEAAFGLLFSSEWKMWSGLTVVSKGTLFFFPIQVRVLFFKEYCDSWLKIEDRSLFSVLLTILLTLKRADSFFLQRISLMPGVCAYLSLFLAQFPSEIINVAQFSANFFSTSALPLLSISTFILPFLIAPNSRMKSQLS